MLPVMHRTFAPEITFIANQTEATLTEATDSRLKSYSSCSNAVTAWAAAFAANAPTVRWSHGQTVHHTTSYLQRTCSNRRVGTT